MSNLVSHENTDQSLHDVLPDEVLISSDVTDEALNRIVEKGLAVAPEAKAIAEKTSLPKEKGKARVSSSSSGKKKSQQRGLSMTERLSEVSASQLQLSEITTTVRDLSNKVESLLIGIENTNMRVDTLSKEQKTTSSNLRASLTSVATKMIAVENSVASLTTRQTAGQKGVAPPLSASALADLALKTGAVAEGSTKVLLTGAGVPSPSAAVRSASSLTTSAKLDRASISAPKVSLGTPSTGSARGSRASFVRGRGRGASLRGLALGTPSIGGYRAPAVMLPQVVVGGQQVSSKPSTPIIAPTVPILVADTGDSVQDVIALDDIREKDQSDSESSSSEGPGGDKREEVLPVETVIGKSPISSLFGWR